MVFTGLEIKCTVPLKGQDCKLNKRPCRRTFKPTTLYTGCTGQRARGKKGNRKGRGGYYGVKRI